MQEKGLKKFPFHELNLNLNIHADYDCVKGVQNH